MSFATLISGPLLSDRPAAARYYGRDGHAVYNYAFSFPRVRTHRATNRGCHAWRTDRHNLRARTRMHLIPIAPVRSERPADIRPARLIRRKDNRPIVS